MNALDYAKRCCDNIMKKFPKAELPPTYKFHYHAGVFLSGMERLYHLCGDEKYSEYIKSYLLQWIDAAGELHGAEEDMLDDLQPCILLYRFADAGNLPFQKVLNDKVPLFLNWKTTSEGGFWHKSHYQNQMWLDGFYMSGPLVVKFGLKNNKRQYIELIHKQLILMWNHMYDENTGLLYHAWDESKESPWANPETGCSPEFWGRAIGWYLVACSDISELLSDDDPLKKDFTDRAVQLATALVKYQDEETGLWYQVVNKGNELGNWLETSCSCMYTYGLSNLLRRGLLDEKYRANADKAFNGIIHHRTSDENGSLIVKGTCIGTGVGDYEHYINRSTVDDDLHGTGAFVLMCTEYEKLNLSRI